MKDVIKSLVPNFIMKEYRSRQQHKMIKSYQGDKVICPLCKSTFKMFAPFGVKKRENARCLNCGSLERHRLLYLYLQNNTNLFKTEGKIRLLHFAPEKAFYEIFSESENIDYVPCDLVPELYDYAGSTKIKKVDITSIPFEDNYFDVILCNHVLEHIPDDAQAMSELHRVMKEGGWGIFQVPIDYSRERTYEDFTITEPKEREKAFGQYDHVRWYGQDYKDRLRSAGLKVTEDNYATRLTQEELTRYGLKPRGYVYYCTK